VSEQLLELLKLCLLALLYLFLLRVVWAVGSQLRTPAAIGSGGGAVGRGGSAARSVKEPRAKRTRSTVPTQLVLRAPADRSGTTYDLVDGLTIGRAVGNTVTLDDTFVSQHHARLVLGESGWVFEDLRSTNGSLHNGQRVGQPVDVRSGDRIQIGDTVMEAR
jgi:FHA domain